MANATETKVAEKCIAERINQNVVWMKITVEDLGLPRVQVRQTTPNSSDNPDKFDTVDAFLTDHIA